jgi:hypothetical protein
VDTPSRTGLIATSTEEIGPGEEAPISGFLTLPPVPPSELVYCDFIVIKYKGKIQDQADEGNRITN